MKLCLWDSKEKVQNGSYKGLIKSEAVYKGTNKIYDYFTCEAKPNKGNVHCPRAQRLQARHLMARINCQALNKPLIIFFIGALINCLSLNNPLITTIIS